MDIVARFTRCTFFGCTELAFAAPHHTHPCPVPTLPWVHTCTPHTRFYVPFPTGACTAYAPRCVLLLGSRIYLPPRAAACHPAHGFCAAGLRGSLLPHLPVPARTPPAGLRGSALPHRLPRRLPPAHLHLPACATPGSFLRSLLFLHHLHLPAYGSPRTLPGCIRSAFSRYAHMRACCLVPYATAALPLRSCYLAVPGCRFRGLYTMPPSWRAARCGLASCCFLTPAALPHFAVYAHHTLPHHLPRTVGTARTTRTVGLPWDYLVYLALVYTTARRLHHHLFTPPTVLRLWLRAVLRSACRSTVAAGAALRIPPPAPPRFLPHRCCQHLPRRHLIAAVLGFGCRNTCHHHPCCHGSHFLPSPTSACAMRAPAPIFPTCFYRAAYHKHRIPSGSTCHLPRKRIPSAFPHLPRACAPRFAGSACCAGSFCCGPASRLDAHLTTTVRAPPVAMRCLLRRLRGLVRYCLFCHRYVLHCCLACCARTATIHATSAATLLPAACLAPAAAGALLAAQALLRATLSVPVGHLCQQRGGRRLPLCSASSYCLITCSAPASLPSHYTCAMPRLVLRLQTRAP